MFVRPLKLTQHVDIQGPVDAPVLVLLHSLGTDLHLWDPQVEKLKEDYRVVRVDIRGHGLSDVDHSPFSIEDLADDVLGALDSVGIGKVFVAGVSIGGTIAQWMAYKAPHRVRAMIIIDTSLINAAPPAVWRARAEDVYNHGIDHLVQEIVSRWVTPEFVGTPEADGMRQMLRRTSVEGFSGCSIAIANTDLRQMDIENVPAFVMIGEKDTLTPLSAARELATKRHADLVIIPNAAHLPNLEQPEVLTEKIRSYLQNYR
ncbi:MAG: alpha/beta fold hydrolase [Telmatospirillum sp.]|nr:alpha/beta fold hydrolase [Telmatospirillum sp.]